MSASPDPHLWTIVLAGGDGVRLRQLTRALHGEECPKQFALIHGGRSLMQATVTRAARWSAPERIVVVVAAEREAMAREQLRAHGAVEVVAQPRNRGTGPGILLPLSRILVRDPLARVVILPSDHYVRDEEPFEQSIRRAIATSQDQIALIGAVPDHAETQYGWIVRGSALSGRRNRVARFCEKPAAALAERLLRDGALWNTFIMAGSASQFWQLGCEQLPVPASLFEIYQARMDTPDEEFVLSEIYARMPEADFSRDVLSKATGLGVVPLHDCGWSDWGTPERVLESLRHHSDFAVLSRRLALAQAC
jgi:mannose-1-phosphate guanylyltransferase